MTNIINTYNLKEKDAISTEGSNGWLLKWRLNQGNKVIWVKSPGLIILNI